MRITDEFDRDILRYAFRYALGRQSYAVGIVIDELKRNWKDLRPFDRDQVKKEIREALSRWDTQSRTGGYHVYSAMPDDIVRSWKAVLGWDDCVD